MSTTELFVEQVLAGLLGALIFLLPWLPDWLPCLAGMQTAEAVLGGGVGLGLAYLLGVALDRLADTLTEELDRHNRLRFALSDLESDEFAERLKACEDPFPEDRLRIQALRDAEPAAKWIDYLRSRVRLSRILAVFAPGLTLSAVLSSTGLLQASERWRAEWVAVVPVAYAVATVLVVLRNEIDSKKQWRLWWLAPRTNSKKAVSEYAGEHGFGSVPDAGRKRRGLMIALCVDPAICTAAMLLLGALVLAISTMQPGVVLMAMGGTLLSILAGWSWWRVSVTFRTYLRQLDKYPAPNSRPA